MKELMFSIVITVIFSVLVTLAVYGGSYMAVEAAWDKIQKECPKDKE